MTLWKFWQPDPPGYDEDAPDNARLPSNDCGENYVFSINGSPVLGELDPRTPMPGQKTPCLRGAIGFALGAILGIVRASKVDDRLAQASVFDGETDVDHVTEEVLDEYRTKFRFAGARDEYADDDAPADD